ncbi:MAG: hypothetical protein ACRC30_14725 [Clostridium sp.]
MGIIKMELKRAILSRRFIWAILIGIIGQILGVVAINYKHIINIFKGMADPEMLQSMFNADMLWYFSTQVSFITTVIICSIPFSSSLIEDKKNKYINYIKIRTEYKKYIIGKTIACFTTGFLSVFVSTAIFLIVISFSKYYEPIKVSTTFLENLKAISLNMYFFMYTLIVSLMGGVYALMGLAISTKIKSIAASTIFPVIYYSLATYIFSFLGMSYLEPAAVNVYFARYEVTGIHIFGQLIFYFILSIGIIFISERNEINGYKGA